MYWDKVILNQPCDVIKKDDLFNNNHLSISDLLPQEGGDGKQGECFRKISLDNQITTKSDKKVYVIFLSLIKTIRPFFPGWIINIVPGTKKGTV